MSGLLLRNARLVYADGTTLGELWSLGALAVDCAAGSVYEFLVAK